MKGYPMKTTFAFAVGGPQCQSAQNSQNAQATNAPPPSSSEPAANQNPSAAPAPTSPAEAAAQLGNKLAGLFKKNSEQRAGGCKRAERQRQRRRHAGRGRRQPAPADGLIPDHHA